MISPCECRKILENKAEKLSDEQIQNIIDYFQLLSSIINKQIKEQIK